MADDEIRTLVSEIFQASFAMMDKEGKSRSRSARSRRKTLRLLSYHFARCHDFLASTGQTLTNKDVDFIEGTIGPVVGDVFRHGGIRCSVITEKCVELMAILRAKGKQDEHQ